MPIMQAFLTCDNLVISSLVINLVTLMNAHIKAYAMKNGSKNDYQM